VILFFSPPFLLQLQWSLRISVDASRKWLLTTSLYSLCTNCLLGESGKENTEREKNKKDTRRKKKKTVARCQTVLSMRQF
jgi:hypothetical protein